MLRYITTDGRIEICWPCRVVEDGDEVVALYIAAGTEYRAGPKLTAAEKRSSDKPFLPPSTFVWRHDTLRLMLPGRSHSVWVFSEARGNGRALLKYFVNLEEPFRRTAIGFDTQDHTLDIELTPELDWRWRDELELANHVTEGFYTAELAAAVRAEAERALEAIRRGEHECLRGWREWNPPPEWRVPAFLDGWDTAPASSWSLRSWAYGEDR